MNPAPRRILLSGATGLIGSALLGRLESDGHQVTVLSRRARSGPRPCIVWRPGAGDAGLEAASLEGFDAFIHLAGENIAAGRWTAERRRRIRDSRVRPTAALAALGARLQSPPRVLLCASAIGFYGDRGAEVLDESASPGAGFLPDVCLAWEAALDPARSAGIRTVSLRTGIVLASRGGALARMLPVFRLGLGGPLGAGGQYMSWIHLDDMVATIRHALLRESLAGPLNCVAPRPVTNAEFTRALAAALRRPALFRVPAPVLRALLGDMARDLLLSSTRVIPRRLIESGFVFRHPELPAALQSLLVRV